MVEIDQALPEIDQLLTRSDRAAEPPAARRRGDPLPNLVARTSQAESLAWLADQRQLASQANQAARETERPMNAGLMDVPRSRTPAPRVRVAVVGEDPTLGTRLTAALEPSDGVVRCFTSVREALPPGASPAFDAIVLELQLGPKSGIHACAELRRSGFRGAVLVVSRIADPRVVVLALGSGADDYVIKPFHTDVLVARILAVLRRCRARERTRRRTVAFGAIELDVRGAGAWVRDEYKQLAPLRYRLLELLVARRGGELPVRGICDLIQGEHRTPQAIENLIWHLRRDLGCNGDIILRRSGCIALAPQPRPRRPRVR